MTSPLKIGELARESGASVRMLRFYEQLGLLAPVRNAAGYRLYDAADVALVRKVRLLNQAGLPLKTLALMRDCLRDEPQDFCAELRRALHAQQAEIARQMLLLGQSQALLASLIGGRMNTYETADYFRQPLLKRAHDIYSLFLVGALIGWLTIPAGSVLALAAWRRTQDATLASHFRFQAFSTLWMVMAVALGIAAFFALRAFADPVICPLNRVFLPPRWSTLFVVFYGMVLYALWLVRFWRGYKLLSRGVGIKNPFTPGLPRGL